MRFYEKIVFLRKKRSISQEQLAKKLGVSRQAVYKWEADLSTPELEKIKKMAQIFEVSYDILLNDDIDLDEYFSNTVKVTEIKKEEIEASDIKSNIKKEEITDASTSIVKGQAVSKVPKKAKWIAFVIAIFLVAFAVTVTIALSPWKNAGTGQDLATDYNSILKNDSNITNSEIQSTLPNDNITALPEDGVNTDSETLDSLSPDTQSGETQSSTLTPDSQKPTDKDPEPHVCDFSHWVTTKHVSCFQNGEEKSECTCGAVQTRQIYAKGHTSVITLEAVEPSCEKTGLTQGSKCTACKEVIIAQRLIPNSHNFVDGVCIKCQNPMYTEGVIYELKNSQWQVVGIEKDCTDEVIYISPYYIEEGSDTPHKVTGIYSIGGESIKELVIPEGIKEIRNSAFYNKMENLEAIHIPTTLSVNSLIFEYCPNITRVYINDSSNWCKQIDFYMMFEENPQPIIRSNYDMYLKGELLEDLYIDETVDKIFPHTFTNCKSIKRVIMAENENRDVMEYAFSWCYGLTYAEIDGSIQTNAFSYSSELKSVKLLKNAYIIDKYTDSVLEQCPKLSEIWCNKQHADGTKCTYEDKVKCVHHDSNAQSRVKTTQDGYVYIDTDKIVYLLSYVGQSSVITLPRSIEGKAPVVTAHFIRGTAFGVRVVSVIIPKEILVIEKGAYTFFKQKNIFCEATKKPDGWADAWDDESIVWGYTISK